MILKNKQLNKSVNYSKVFKIFSRCYMVLILIWVCTFVLAIISKNKSVIKFLPYMGCIVALPMILVLIGVLFLLFYIFIGSLIKSNKWYFKLLGFLFALSFGLFMSGFGIWLLGIPFEGQYEVREVSVLDVRNNKILVACPKYCNSENKIIEIHKPFFLNPKENDVIYVKYPINQIDKMHYVIDSKIGEKILLFGIMLGAILFFVTIMVFIMFIIITNLFLKK